MATNTTDRNSYLLNLNSLNNVIQNASGISATTTALSNLQNVINTNTYSISINSIKSFSGSNLTCAANLNLSNSAIYFNSNIGVTSNSINGTSYLAIKTSTTERARFTSNGVGLGITAPLTDLDINGSELVRGNLYISTMGTPAAIGNVYADGNMFAAGFFSPSDEILKQNIETYTSPGLPTPVQFTWRATGAADIGFLAQDVAKVAPACVCTYNGIHHVDYQKLLVLCTAEIIALKAEVSTLKAHIG
jgi:hypothetical protein